MATGSGLYRATYDTAKAALFDKLCNKDATLCSLVAPKRPVKFIELLPALLPLELLVFSSYSIASFQYLSGLLIAIYADVFLM